MSTERVEFRHTNWHCVKCGKEMIQPSNEPLRLQPTLEPKQKIGRCDRCRTRRMFKHSSEM